MNPSPKDPITRRGYWADAAIFLRSWVRAPGRTGAVLPSSRFLASAMTAVLVDLASPTVAELGPGTGALTADIQRRLAGSGTHVAVELNSDFAAHLARRFPDVEVVNDSATELVKLLEKRDIQAADVVVSGLPFASFPAELQRDVLDAVAESLTEDGVFVTFNYVGAYSTPAARRFRLLLSERFAEVSISRPVILNIPPAKVLTARGVKRDRARERRLDRM